jgi:glycosyltransferase involved in cell wall biosynthesis
MRRNINNLKETLGEFDILVATFFPMNWIITQFNKKTIYICFEPFPWFHDCNMMNSLPLLERTLVKFAKVFYSSYDESGTKNVDRILVLSGFIASKIRDIYGRDALICREGVDTEHFRRKTSSDFSKKYEGYDIILHSASFTPINRTDLLVKALPKVMKEVPNVRLLIMQKMDRPKGRKKICDLAKKVGAINKIEFLPFIEENMLPYYYSLASVLVQPTQNQSASLPVKEAMACGTPVIACRGDGTEEDIGNDGILVPIEQPDELASAIIQILKNPSLRKQMGKNGRERVKKVFNWDKVANVIWGSVQE